MSNKMKNYIVIEIPLWLLILIIGVLIVNIIYQTLDYSSKISIIDTSSAVEREKDAKIDELSISNILEQEMIEENDNNSMIEQKNVEEKSVEVTKVNLDENKIEIGVGQSYILLATVESNNDTKNCIVWKSTNDKVITVNEGMIKAVGEGTAEVIVSCNNLEARCVCNVIKNKTSDKIYYVTQNFNVRNGPGTNYKILYTVKKNEEIELLKETSDWAKIRILKNGIVGYTVIKKYSSKRTNYISGVPFLDQMKLGYPTGCEAVSATMAAKYAGYNVDVKTIIANTPTDELGKRQEKIEKKVEREIINEQTGETKIETIIEEEKIWVGENPFKYFVGYPTKRRDEGSYGCYAAPIEEALKKSNVACTNISGCSVNELYKYIQQGKPVVVWCRIKGLDLQEGVTWKYPDGSGEYLELVGEHCAVLIGYDDNNVYLNDPYVGKDVSQSRAKFESNWYKLYSQAIIIQ